MAFLNGNRSVYRAPLYTIDDWAARVAGDLITSEEWNALGDAIYNTELVTRQLQQSQKAFSICPGAAMWCANLPVSWWLTYNNQLSVTGQVIIPSSATTILGTNFPFRPQNLVKAQLVVNMVAGTRNFTGSNMTTAVWCPSTNSTFSPPATDVFWRTMYVGLSFDGSPPPDTLNSFDQHLSILILNPLGV